MTSLLTVYQVLGIIKKKYTHNEKCNNETTGQWKKPSENQMQIKQCDDTLCKSDHLFVNDTVTSSVYSI